MTYTEYIQELNAAKDAAERAIMGIVPDFERAAYQALINWIDDHLDTKGGKIVTDINTSFVLNTFDTSFLQELADMPIYTGAVAGFLKQLPGITTIMQAYQVENNGINWDRANVVPNQALVVNEIINAYDTNGLNVNFVQPLRDQLYQNIAAGTSLKEAKQGLKDYVLGGKDKSGKLDRYITQTAQQSVDSYAGAINKKLMDTFEYPYLIMSGSLIETSSPQCRYAINELKGLINVQEWENVVRPIAEKNGLIDGTTFKNMPFNKLHWGCRHEFTPSMLKPGDKIGKNETV